MFARNVLIQKHLGMHCMHSHKLQTQELCCQSCISKMQSVKGEEFINMSFSVWNAMKTFAEIAFYRIMNKMNTTAWIANNSYKWFMEWIGPPKGLRSARFEWGFLSWGFSGEGTLVWADAGHMLRNCVNLYCFNYV